MALQNSLFALAFSALLFVPVAARAEARHAASPVTVARAPASSASHYHPGPSPATSRRDGRYELRTVNYQVPGRWRPFLKCWGDTPHESENPYTVTNYQCSSEEDIFLSEQQRTGVVAYDHAFLSSDRLGALRFSALYSATFGNDPGGVEATRDDVTNFRCQQGFVKVGALTVRTVLCLRAYKRLPGLYDLALRAATNNESTAGVQTSLDLAGFSADNARALARRYLEALAWTK